jgi:molybdopterin-guanine dinucleotide biosynthesis protein
MKKSTFVFVIIGCEGSGKTYLARSFLKKVHPDARLIFDVNNEHHDLYPFPFDKSMDNFLTKIEKRKNCVSLFEDATSFFSTNGREQKLIELLIERRHTGNSFIFLFHSFQDVPKYILRRSTDIIIFKTKDLPEYMRTNYKGTVYLEGWTKVQEQAKTHKFFSSYPPPSGIAPPSCHIKQ